MFDCISNLSADWTNALVAAGALVVSFAAFGVACWSAYLAKKAAQAQLVTPFLNEYAGNEMLNALKKLKEWKETNRHLLQDIAQLSNAPEYTIERCLGSAQCAVDDTEIDEARRLVNLYFKRAYKLWKYKLLDRKATHCIIDNEAFRGLFCEVVTPLTLAVGLVRIWNNDPAKFVKERKKDVWRNELAQLYSRGKTV